ncbi:hypothetical protein BHM03_00046908, partial [Ensete ventricosum]
PSFSQNDALAPLHPRSRPPAQAAALGIAVSDAAPCERAVGSRPLWPGRWRSPLRAGHSRLCPRAVAAPAGGRPLQGAWPQPAACRGALAATDRCLLACGRLPLLLAAYAAKTQQECVE